MRPPGFAKGRSSDRAWTPTNDPNRTFAGWLTGSDTDEALRYAGHDTLEAQRRIRGRETDAIHPFFRDRSVLRVLVGNFDIAASETVGLVSEGPLQNQGQFHSAVTMIRHGRATRYGQKPHIRFARSLEQSLTDTTAYGTPFHTAKVSADVRPQR